MQYFHTQTVVILVWATQTSTARPGKFNIPFSQNNLLAAIEDNGRHNSNDDNTAMHHHKSYKTLSSQKARRETKTNNEGG